MVSTLAPSRRQKAASLSTACGSAPSGGVRMHQRLTNSSAKPASGPEYSVPATGCAGTKCTLFGRCGAMSRTTAPLTEPTSETMAPGARCGADLRRHRAAGADRNADDDEIGAFDRGGIALDHLIGQPELGHAPARLRPSARWPRSSRAAPCARAARAIEEPISPTPISASRLNRVAGVLTPSSPGTPPAPAPPGGWPLRCPTVMRKAFGSL